MDTYKYPRKCYWPNRKKVILMICASIGTIRRTIEKEATLMEWCNSSGEKEDLNSHMKRGNKKNGGRGNLSEEHPLHGEDWGWGKEIRW